VSIVATSSNETIDLLGSGGVSVTAWLSGVNSERAVSVRVARFMVKGEYLCTFYVFSRCDSRAARFKEAKI